MAFCKYCGNSVEDGQVCTCAQAQAAAQAAPAAQASAQTAVVDAAKSVKPYLTDYFVNPAKAIRNIVESDNNSMAIVLTVIRALALGLAVFGLLRKLCATIMGGITAATGAIGGMGGMGSAMAGAMGAMGPSIKVNSLKF